ncbi:MAG: OmpA family protein [Campylobacteraceae bacterium]|jgi:OOP family OmpA-OmpF porin|nr:OmpA family protein [Campylobacteraceae bacterium]
MKKFLFAFMAGVTFLCAVPSEITPVIGGAHPFDSDKAKDHLTYGLRLGLGIDNTFIDQIELGYDYSKDVKHHKTEKNDFHRVYLNAIKEFSVSNKSKLYGIIGLGHEDISGKSYDKGATTFSQYGVGVKYYFDNYFSVRGEVRYATRFNSDNSNLFYTVGFSVPIGNVEKAPVVEPAAQVEENADILVEEGNITVDDDDIVIIDIDDEEIIPDIVIEEEDEEESQIVKDITKVMSLSIQGFDSEAAKRKKHFNFDFDSAKILKGDEEVAERIAKDLGEFQNIRVRNEGHADAIGSNFYNLKLSQKRSEAVKNKLIEYGVAESQIETKGYGSSKPVRDNDTPEGRAENRRVNVVFIAPVYYFELDSAELTQDGEETLKAIAEKLAGYDKTIIKVEGHTDSTGSKLHNLKLSQKRADKVRDKLVEYGINPVSIETKGLGSAYPIKSNDTKEGRAANRRVDILFVDREN